MVLNFRDKIPSREECGCGLSHENTLDKVVIGNNVLEYLPSLLEDAGIKGCGAIFYDETTFRVAGERVLKLIKGRGFTVSEPTYREAENKSRMLKGASFVVAVGGGTVIDVAKYIAYVNNMPFISIPTTLSHDGIVSPIVSLFHESAYRKSILTRAPVLSLIDLEVISTSPRILILSGVGDILAKTVSLKDWQLGRDEVGEPYCYTSEKYVMNALKTVIDMLKMNVLDLVKLAEALTFSGISMMVAGSSRPASGSEHLYSHYLDRHSPRRAPHGIQCAQGTLLTALYHKLHNPNWWREEEYDWKNLKMYMLCVEMPLNLEKLGIPTRIAIEALVNAVEIRPERITILHKRRPTHKEALELLRETGLVEQADTTL
ncbi:MAG: iron-containing alcohol dehydrogenase [Aigarchaeota archaeon]|nr:iron-containing alcohol dehydrogenase [Candidatus Geocrenenecus dongiae]